MKKIIIAAAALFIAGVFIYQHSGSWGARVKAALGGKAPAVVPRDPSGTRRSGETMTYDVRLGKLKIGTSVFRRLPDTTLDGRRVQAMLFETDCARLKDREEIFSDPETFLPVEVRRDIVSMLVREQITEHYDQKNFTLTITKWKKGRAAAGQVIRRDAPIQHPILLPHYIRDLPELAVGQVFQVVLPNRSFTVELTGIEDVSVPLGNIRAYRFESTPRQIAIWVSADERRLPLKIQGVGLMNYAMMLREYVPADSAR